MELADSLGMLNSAIQFAAGQVGAVKDKDWIEEENQKSRDFQLEMWNKANEYNSPSKVLERYKMAGIDVNPNYLVTGNYQPANASLASSPGHSAPNMNSKDLGKYFDLNSYAQMRNQNRLVDSQIEVNDSVISKNIAQAEESRSQIPSNLNQGHYFDALTTKAKNENLWFDLTLDQKQAILDLDQAIKAGQEILVNKQWQYFDAQTKNNNRLTDLRIQATAEVLAQGWQRLKLDERELVGKLEYWAKSGNAAMLNAKANFLNALTNSDAFSLEKDKYEKFSDSQLELLRANVSRLTKANAWYDILQEENVHNMTQNRELAKERGEYIQNQNDTFEMQFYMGLFKDLLEVAY